jgi:hypothetical protein
VESVFGQLFATEVGLGIASEAAEKRLPAVILSPFIVILSGAKDLSSCRIHPDKNRLDLCATRGNAHFFERNPIPNDRNTRPHVFLLSFQQHSGFVSIIY